MSKYAMSVSTLAIAVAMTAPLCSAQAESRAKNVILMIGDGMGPSVVRAAELYSERVLKRDMAIVQLMKRGNVAFLTNDTYDAINTESAAAAGQIATGQKQVVRALSVAPDGKTPVRTIGEAAKDKKLAIGLVTTSGITDATPAAFAAHVPNRAAEDDVASQELAMGVDVLMGGRRVFFEPADKGGKRKDGRDLTEEAKKAGYTFVTNADELKTAPDGKILGLFNKGDLAYEVERGATKEPSLVDMTKKTLAILSKNPNGFFAMIEGGRIDHAAHRNDAGAAIIDTIAFDEAVAAAAEFVKANPDTLLMVTADHETGGMGLIGHSKESKEYVGINLEAIKNVKVSFETLADKFGKDPDPAKIKALVKEADGIDITDDEAKTVADDTVKKLDPWNYSYDYLHSLGFVLRPYLRVGYTSQTHTASPLHLIGVGPGSELIKGQMHNTEIFKVMSVALDAK